MLCSFQFCATSWETPEYAYYFTYAPKGKSALKTLVRMAGRRWEMEMAFQAAKGECGLDHYEVRNWRGWHRHVTLSMLAHAALAVLRARGEKNFPKRGPAQRSGNTPSSRTPALPRRLRHRASS